MIPAGGFQQLLGLQQPTQSQQSQQPNLLTHPKPTTSEQQHQQQPQQQTNKKRQSTSGISPDNVGFWNDFDEDDYAAVDPRKEDWKIQKKKGFAKDHDDKAKMMKASKISKTSKRNSKAPMSDIEMRDMNGILSMFVDIN